MQNNIEEVPPQAPSKSIILMGLEFTFEFVKTTLFVVCVALLFRYFLLQPFIVVGQSMEPNFHDKEYLVVDKLSYRIREPNRGEVVIFHPPQYPKESYIKRIIGLPGEEVEIKSGKVYINGHLLEENYIQISNEKQVGVKDMKIVLDEERFFVLGDNRDHSSDSREIGPIPKDNLQGKVTLILFPITEIRHPQTPQYSMEISLAPMLSSL